MNAEQRLNLISKIAQNDHYFTDGDEYWLIGMLSDTTMSDDALMQQIEAVKTGFPKYAQFLECSKNQLKMSQVITLGWKLFNKQYLNPSIVLGASRAP